MGKRRKQVRFDAHSGLVDKFDEAVGEHEGYQSRSEALRDFMRQFTDTTLADGNITWNQPAPHPDGCTCMWCREDTEQ